MISVRGLRSCGPPAAQCGVPPCGAGSVGFACNAQCSAAVLRAAFVPSVLAVVLGASRAISTSLGSTHRVWPQPGVCPAAAAALHGTNAVLRSTASARRPERAPCEGGVAGTCTTAAFLHAEWLEQFARPGCCCLAQATHCFSPCRCCYRLAATPAPRARPRTARSRDSSHRRPLRSKTPAAPPPAPRLH